MTITTHPHPLRLTFGLVALMVLSFACDLDVLSSARNAGDDEDDDGYVAGICGAAEAVDDSCEAAFGEDVDDCKPFDDVDEACEAGEVPPECETAEALDDACELLFGDDAEECQPLDDIDEACEAEFGADDSDDEERRVDGRS